MTETDDLKAQLEQALSNLTIGWPEYVLASDEKGSVLDAILPLVEREMAKLEQEAANAMKALAREKQALQSRVDATVAWLQDQATLQQVGYSTYISTGPVLIHEVLARLAPTGAGGNHD